jgi:hypothetical protein
MSELESSGVSGSNARARSPPASRSHAGTSFGCNSTSVGTTAVPSARSSSGFVSPKLTRASAAWWCQWHRHIPYKIWARTELDFANLRDSEAFRAIVA